MTNAADTAAPYGLSDEALREFARERESNPVERPGVSRLLAVAFLALAVAALFLPAHRGISALAVVISLLSYAVARQVQIEFTTFYLVPTEAVFVVMWFVLPLRLVPLVVCAAMILGDLPTALRGRAPLERTIVLNVAASWFAVGPALVLYLAGAGVPRWSDVWIYACALLAQFALDFVTTLLLQRAALGAVSVRNHLRTIAAAASYDLLLAPVGLLAAFPAHRRPLVMVLLLPVLVIVQRIASEREARHTHEIELKKAYQGTSYLLGDIIEADDEYTGAHSREVVHLVLEVSQRLGLDADALRIAEFTALLHDVGKVKIPAAIINKPGPLDPAEQALMQSHAALGGEMLEPIGGILGEVGRMVRSCHERWDGGGYPDGLAGTDIPLVARIVCACDAWSAMTADRPYRPALSRDAALAELRLGAGTQFDPVVAAELESALGL